MDPLAYLPMVGSTVFIGSYPAVIAGSAGMATPPHIPLGGMFVKPPMSESEQFMGSSTVNFDGDAAGYNGLPALSDVDIGMPAPVRPKKKGGAAKSLFLPVSSATAIPKGKPVLVGGAPSIMGAFMNAAMGAGMGKAMGAAGAMGKSAAKALQKTKAAKKVSGVAHKAAAKVMDKAGIKRGSKLRDKVHDSICTVTGHPVDVATGNMFDVFEDFRIGQSAPFVWRRKYNSTHADTPGPLGRGFTHSHDVWLKRRANQVEVRLSDGRDVTFLGKLIVGGALHKEEDNLSLRRPSKAVIELEDGEKSIYRFQRNDSVQDLFIASELEMKGGRTLRYRYDQDVRLVAIEDGKRVIEVVWEADRIIGVRGPNPVQGSTARGHGTWMVRYDYDAQKRLIAVRDQAQQVARFEYLEDTGLVVKEQRKNGLHFYFEYDGADAEAKCTRTWGDGGIFDHRLVYADDATEVTDSLGNKRIYQHEGGLVTELTDELGGVSKTVRDEHRRVIEEIDALGRSTQYRYDQRGNLTSLHRPDGGMTSIAYDKDDLPVQVVHPSGRTFKYGYNHQCQLAWEEGPDGAVTRYGYEGPNLTSVLEPGERRTEYDYDENGELVRILEPNGAETELYRDGLGRIVQIIDADENVEYRRYNGQGQLYEIERPNGQVVKLRYDADGNVVRKDDGREVSTYEYFGLGQLKARTINGKREEVQHDTEGQVVSYTDAWGQKTKYQLNEKGDLVQETNPFGMKTRFRRNAEGELSAIVHPDGKLTRLSRDTLGQVVEVQHKTEAKTGALGDVVETFSYDEDALLTQAIRSRASETVRVELNRDRAGRVVEELVEERNQDGTTTHQETVSRYFGAAGDLEEVRSSLGFIQAYRRDGSGQLTAVTGTAIRTFEGPKPRFDFHTELGRNQFGEIIHRKMSGFQVKYRHDKVGELQEVEVFGVGETKEQQKTLLRRSIRPEAYCKDHLERAGREGLARMADHNFSFLGAALLSGETEMSLSGELTRLYRDRGSKADWSKGPADQLVQQKDEQGRWTEYLYNRYGQIKERRGPTGHWRYRYDASGKLRKVYRSDGRVVQLKYDALGRCIERSDEQVTVRFVWSGDVPLHELRIERKSPRRGGASASGEPATLCAADAARLGGMVVKTWLFSPEDRTLLGKVEHDHDGRVSEEATWYALNDEAGMPCALLDAEGKTRWKDDKWRERRGCFVAGTLVHTQHGPLPLEKVPLGAKMKTARSVQEEADKQQGGMVKSILRAGLAIAASMAAALVPAASSAAVEAQPAAVAETEEHQIATLAFAADDDSEHVYSLELLRPRTWFEQQGVSKTGDRCRLELDELQAEGWATVTSIQPTELRTETRSSIMRLSHEAGMGDVYEVGFVEGDEVLRVTGLHPLYSVDRDEWVRVLDLQVGERLQTAEGAVTVEALEKVRGGHRVYNLEVEGDHEYLVGEAGVRSHNACPDGTDIVEHGSKSAARRAALREAGIPVGTPPSRSVPSRPGSRSPSGPPGERLEWDPVSDRGVGAHFDEFGHKFDDGTSIPPHYGVDAPGRPTRHHTYPSDHDPTTNR